MAHKFIWASAKVLKKLCNLGVLKMTVTLFTNSLVEKLVIESSASSPSGIRPKEHDMVIVHYQIFSNVRFRTVTIYRRLLVDKLLDHVRGAKNYHSLWSHFQ